MDMQLFFGFNEFVVSFYLLMLGIVGTMFGHMFFIPAYIHSAKKYNVLTNYAVKDGLFVSLVGAISGVVLIISLFVLLNCFFK